VANHDFIFPYCPEMENYLRKEDCDVPPVRPGNREPLKQEVLEAIESQGLGAVDHGGAYIDVVPPPNGPPVVEQMTGKVEFIECHDGQAVQSPDRPPINSLVGIRCFAWDKLGVDEEVSVTMRGNFPLELFLVHELSRHCGQLVLYPDPDSGDPPVVLEPGCDIGRMATVWLEVVEVRAPWAEFYQRVNSAENS